MKAVEHKLSVRTCDYCCVRYLLYWFCI